MSEVAGRMSVQAGASNLEKARGGNGTLLGGVPGVEPGRVLVLGGGVVGTNAARMAIGMGADVTYWIGHCRASRSWIHNFRAVLKQCTPPQIRLNGTPWTRTW